MNFLSHVSYVTCDHTCFAWKCASLSFQPKCFACLCNRLLSRCICSFITCCVTVTSAGRHLATYFAEWHKANTILSCSTLCRECKLRWHWCGFKLSSFIVKLKVRQTSQSVLNALLQNVDASLGERFSALLVHIAGPCTAWKGFGQMRLSTTLCG